MNGGATVEKTKNNLPVARLWHLAGSSFPKSQFDRQHCENEYKILLLCTTRSVEQKDSVQRRRASQSWEGKTDMHVTEGETAYK